MKSYGASEDDRKNSKDFARIVNGKHFQRLKNLIEKSVNQGAKIEMGGVFDENEKYIAPTILTSVTAGQEIMKEEIFGPILPVMAYENINEVYSYIQGNDKPLTLYVFSKKKNFVEEVLKNTSSGGVTVNDVMTHIVNHSLPFGGVGPSGFGNYHGHHGFKAFSHERAVMKKTGMSSVALFHPPYGKIWVRKILKFVSQWMV
jgi:aldehyde dehydrogenase (NAD+)